MPPLFSGSVPRREQSLAKKARISFEEKNNWLKDIPAGRFADASGTAAAIASPAASYINGINLPAEGRRAMGLFA